MRSILYALTTLAVIGLAFWAYRENYATQSALSKTDQLHREIRIAHARLSVLRAEWAYLNRPERLHDLAEINFDTLGLLPFRADQFGRVDEVAYPAPPQLEISDSIEVSGTLTPEISQDREGE